MRKVVFIIIPLLFSQVIVLAQSKDTIEERIFPLMKKLAKKANSNGQELPLPFGINASMYFQEQAMDIQQIAIGDFQVSTEGQFIDINGSQISNTTFTSQLRGDLWLFPFLNIYGMAGQVTTFNNIELLINLNIPPIPGITPGDLKTIERKEIAKINGGVFGGGIVIAFGYKRFFTNINVSFARTFLSELKSSQDAFIAFPMIGYSTNFANFFAATMYKNKGQANKGSFINSNGTPTNYSIVFNSKDWNLIFGMNKTINHWSMNFMLGFGPRTNSLIEIGYRL